MMCLASWLARLVGHVGGAAQLDGDGEAGLGMGEALAKTSLPLPPDLGAGFVKGCRPESMASRVRRERRKRASGSQRSAQGVSV